MIRKFNVVTRTIYKVLIYFYALHMSMLLHYGQTAYSITSLCGMPTSLCDVFDKISLRSRCWSKICEKSTSSKLDIALSGSLKNSYKIVRNKGLHAVLHGFRSRIQSRQHHRHTLIASLVTRHFSISITGDNVWTPQAILCLGFVHKGSLYVISNRALHAFKFKTSIGSSTPPITYS